jgi:hypothetical protein
MTTSIYTITEAFGTDTEIARLRDQAIGIARATGSVGATSSESNWDSATEKTTLTASVTVSRI